MTSEELEKSESYTRQNFPRDERKRVELFETDDEDVNLLEQLWTEVAAKQESADEQPVAA